MERSGGLVPSSDASPGVTHACACVGDSERRRLGAEPEFGLWLEDTDVCLEHYVNGGIHNASPPQASVVRSGATWTWKVRIPALRFGGLTAFRFNVHVNTEVQEQVSDCAPNDQGWWYYDLKSR
jgi:hypothetical protein